MWCRWIAAVIVLVASSAHGAPPPHQSWALTHDIQLDAIWTAGGRTHTDRVTADLYRPETPGRQAMPAAVIINSSGGVSAHTEHHYAQTFAAQGMASLVVDSFIPRGVRRTGDDQSRLSQRQSDADAIAAFKWLSAQPWVDPQRIIVIGMSKGGTTALDTALVQYRQYLPAGGVSFAAHVAVVPGNCNLQPKDARTVKVPIFFMFAELDDGTPMAPCLALAGRMERAGNPLIRIAVYPGVFHAYEWTGGIAYDSDDETARNCKGIFLDEERRLIDASTGVRLTQGSDRDYLLKTCVERGYNVGGDARVKSQATADLLQFLRDVDVLRDEEARAVVPDCAKIGARPRRRNCERARAGWVGDIVALGRAYRADETAENSAMAVRLFELAAERGHSQGQWELALMLQRGEGIERNETRAATLARSAAEAGDPIGMNIYGVALRDGRGVVRDESEAAQWIRRSADLRDPYAMANLGRMAWTGMDSVAGGKTEAIRLWRLAVAYGKSPWADLYLGEAFAAGEGLSVDKVKAAAYFRAVLSQKLEPEARRRASDGLSRL